ncbi:MAG TPA: cupin domain-containing protein [Burkholderiaceae bacterium]|jgi:mannose-6-phosphate isomerase-like protein (cupin superfamily)
MIQSDDCILVKAADVVTDEISGDVYKAGSRTARVVYSPHASIMVTTRTPGYHSRASAHEGDELDYCVSGEMLIFVGDKGYQVCAGDFIRIRGGAMHWALVSGDTPCTMMHVHTPPFVGNAGAADTAFAALFGGERKGEFPIAKDIFDHDFPTDGVEKAYFAAEAASAAGAHAK